VQPLGEALSSARARRRRVVVPYLMVDRARKPRLREMLAALREAGASALELGFPFSDPIADGPTLEAAADRALAHGTRWSDLLSQVGVASRYLPTAVMTYANPVWARGIDRALSELRQAGATGLIVPDLSLEESAPWRRAALRVGLSLVLLAAPSADPGRAGEIARASRGFLYLVSRFGTTGGAAPSAAADLAPFVSAAHRASPSLAVLVGFGVHDAASARRAVASGADGVIVGSALEERISTGGSARAAGTWLASIARAVGPPGPAAHRVAE